MASKASQLYVCTRFKVTVDIPIDGVPAGKNLAERFKRVSSGVWEMRLKEPIRSRIRGKLSVQIADRDRNVSRIERSFSVKCRNDTKTNRLCLSDLVDVGGPLGYHSYYINEC